MLEQDQVKSVRRQLAALVAQVASDDPAALAQLASIASDLTDEVANAANHLRLVEGYSWADLADEARVARSTIVDRYRRPNLVDPGSMLKDW